MREAFTVKERVAIGTAGIVYHGIASATGEDVTFKVLSPKATHPLDITRLLALRWRLDALKHPVIAELIDEYDDPDGFVIISTWLGSAMGSNLFPVKRRTLTKAEARLVAMRLCGALLQGEQQRFPHGDIKPSNVILADRGPQGLEVQIQDWGLVVCRDHQPPETLQFMAPERHHGHPPSMQGDLFSTAATLWFLLTAEAPAYGFTRQDLLMSWGEFDPTTLKEMRPDLDEHFIQWLGWLLRWQPGDRPQSVSQALDVLNQVVSYAAAMEAKEAKLAEEKRLGEEKAAARAAAVAAAQVRVAAGTPSTAVPLATSPATAASHAPPPRGPVMPVGARPSSPRLQLPVSPPPPPASSGPSRMKDETSKEKANIGQRVMMTIILLCVLAGIGVAFVAWAEDRYGHDWKNKLAEDWERQFGASKAKPAPAAPPAAAKPTAQSSARPATSPAKTASAGGSKPPPPVAKPANSPSKPAPKPPGNPFAADPLDGDGDLKGRTKGTGWKGPWEGKLASIEKGQLIMGKGLGSAATRPLGPLAKLPQDYVTLGIKVIHPGKDAAPLKFELLSPDGKTFIAPAIVAFENGQVRVFIEGASEKVEAPTDKPFRLAVRWEWKNRNAEGKTDVTVSAMVNPPTDPAQVSKTPSSKRMLPAYSLPPDILLLMQSSGASKPALISDLRLGRYLRDALP